MRRRETTELGLWPLVSVPLGDETSLWLRWLVRLRWVAISAQILALAFAFSILATIWLLVPLGIVILLLALVNVRALRALATNEELDPGTLLSQLAIDVLALTGFFVLAGGPDNPFTMLYVIHVAMGAVMLPIERAVALLALVLACSALIHVEYLPLRWDHHALPPTVLVAAGRVVAFSVTAVSVAMFVAGLSHSVRTRNADLLDSRDRTARTDRLRSVGTLAAGAAHEINTPLSTIGLRMRRIARRHADPDTVRDAEVVHTQLDRCAHIVEQLLVGAGDPSASELEHWPIGQVVSDATSLWGKGATVGVQIRDESGAAVVELPRIAFTQALVNLLENAREAQAENGRTEPIEVTLVPDRDGVQITVRDHGVGLKTPADRVGEPFLTTKVTGTGLGVFVARAVAEGAGGTLLHRAAADVGTEAVWWFPTVPDRTPPTPASLPS